MCNTPSSIVILFHFFFEETCLFQLIQKQKSKANNILKYLFEDHIVVSQSKNLMDEI
jgi:hypothetical protein